MNTADEIVEDSGHRRVFVYGTLRQGGSNHHRMAGAKFIAPAIVRGRLYWIDWYPGLILDPEGDTVRGEVYEVDATLFEALDVYEGSEYRKAVTSPQMEEASPVLLWEWDGAVDESRRIHSGDWLEQGRPGAGR